MESFFLLIISFCRFVGAFGNESYLDCPEGMALGPNNTLYVASFLDDRVVKFSIPDGKFLGVVSKWTTATDNVQEKCQLHKKSKHTVGSARSEKNLIVPQQVADKSHGLKGYY